VHRGGEARVVAQHADGALAVVAGTADRAAHVVGVERRQLLDVLLHEVGEPQQEELPLGRLPLAPRPVEGLARGGHGAVDILAIALRDVRQDLAGCRIAAVEGLARRRGHPAAVGQHQLGLAVEIGRADGGSFFHHGHGRLLSVISITI
jgi:hypothetical protein